MILGTLQVSLLSNDVNLLEELEASYVWQFKLVCLFVLFLDVNLLKIFIEFVTTNYSLCFGFLPKSL